MNRSPTYKEDLAPYRYQARDIEEKAVEYLSARIGLDQPLKDAIVKYKSECAEKTSNAAMLRRALRLMFKIPTDVTPADPTQPLR